MWLVRAAGDNFLTATTYCLQEPTAMLGWAEGTAEPEASMLGDPGQGLSRQCACCIWTLDVFAMAI